MNEIKKMVGKRVRLKPEYIRTYIANGIKFIDEDGDETYRWQDEETTDEEWEQFCKEVDGERLQQTGSEVIDVDFNCLPTFIDIDRIYFVEYEFYGIDLYRSKDTDVAEHQLFLSVYGKPGYPLSYPIWKAKYFEVVKAIDTYIKDEEFYK